MSKRIIMICIFMVLLAGVHAQKKLSYVEIDTKSYQLFQEKEWDELIEYVKDVREQGIDFFNLQVRIGIAYYNIEKYRKAADWFLKAWENDKSFEWLQEYVYYSLIFSGRKAEALKHSIYFSPALKENIGLFDKGITQLGYEAGFSFNPSFDELTTREFSNELNLGNDYGEGIFFKNQSFHSFDLSHRVAPNLTINHNVTLVDVNREAYINWGDQTTSPININQFQYFINPTWVLGKKLNVSSSLSFIIGESDLFAGGYNSNWDKTYTLVSKSFSDFVFSTALWSDFKNFVPGIELNTGTISDSRFSQFSSWLTFYPLSNAKLYFIPRVYFKTNSESGKMEWSAAGLSGGVQLDMIHIYGQYLFGNMENFVESAGYLISNFPGRSDRKITGSVYFPYGKKFQFVARYIYHSIVEDYQVYSEGIKSKSLEYNYSKHTLTGGISWSF